MSDAVTPDVEPTDRALARLLVACYPPSWRARYHGEMLALLADTALSARLVADVLGAAALAWMRPARHLHNPTARLRASLAVVLTSWIALAAAALIFGQLYEDESLAPATPGHPVTATLYHLYVFTAHGSVAVLAIATLPLGVRLARDALRRRAYRELTLLSLPVTASVGFLAVLVAVSRATRRGGSGVSPSWFLLLTVVGLLAGALVAAGPTAVLRRQRPEGRLVVLAGLGATAGAATMSVATLAAAANAMAIDAWTPPTGHLHAATSSVVVYVALVMLASTVAWVSAQRAASALRRTRG